MLKKACYMKDYDYVLEVLHICKTNHLKPSPRFLDIVYTFNENAFRYLSSRKLSKHDRNEFFRFSREFREWQKEMNLQDMDKESAIKAVKEHPWKQFKEAQPDGEEDIKNTRKQTFKKKRHSIHKLTDVRLEKGGVRTPPPINTKKWKKVNETDAPKSTKDLIENVILNDNN